MFDISPLNDRLATAVDQTSRSATEGPSSYGPYAFSGPKQNFFSLTVCTLDQYLRYDSEKMFFAPIDSNAEVGPAFLFVICPENGNVISRGSTQSMNVGINEWGTFHPPFFEIHRFQNWHMYNHCSNFWLILQLLLTSRW